MGMNGQIESSFDDSCDAERTVRMVVGATRALCAEEGEIAKLRGDNAQLLRLNIQLREVTGLLRSEIVRLKASHMGSDKRCSIAETMAYELMVQLEQMSATGVRTPASSNGNHR
jgi:hypothetical protein